ncbi:arsenate reductase (glutaredoxin) [Mariprofundus ferrooxydans]|uniref:arsenate reductase (glutaredoxin) n=1 Tax=Mariprofundus ferrooxydans TaxID=314344 RepID=UPI00036AE132|nr:arsenate reductase (glutaredoxin) [Mariprofundus ferrooxydans]
MPVTIYHNPRCSKSRQTLTLLQEQGIEPAIVEYLNTPPTAAELDRILNMLGIEPEALMRKGESEYKEHFSGRSLSRTETIALMVQHPKVIERPIVVTGDKAAIGRPPESVLAIL